MLFSEPKIPQFSLSSDQNSTRPRFSALQRAENSSIVRFLKRQSVWLFVSVLFSEPKIPQFRGGIRMRHKFHSFSALQRAENSSIGYLTRRLHYLYRFQCSSASRKFLNNVTKLVTRPVTEVSVLFSEPKIPQSPEKRRRFPSSAVSVLFSEPKIPQSRPSHLRPSIFPTAMITLRHS